MNGSETAKPHPTVWASLPSAPKEQHLTSHYGHGTTCNHFPWPSQPHLQILGCCVYSLRTTDPKTGEVIVTSDLAETRRICYEMQKRVVTKRHVYVHRWEEGDLVIFHNYGVWHSITGQLGAEKRLMWQVTMRSGRGPEPARAMTVSS